MKRLAIATACASLLASGVNALPVPVERNEVMQRRAVDAWTACIADEFDDRVHEVLMLDFRSREYERKLEDLAEERISERCFDAMPRNYRRIELNGLPFAGGLAEQAIKTANDEPLLMRLSMAAIGKKAPVFSYTDQVANCAVRGAPHLVAGLFETDVASPEETSAIEQLQAVYDVCTRSGSAIEASPLAMRAMLATASYRILAAQDAAAKDSFEESEDDA
jgi:hypothetical protein